MTIYSFGYLSRKRYEQALMQEQGLNFACLYKIEKSRWKCLKQKPGVKAQAIEYNTFDESPFILYGLHADKRFFYCIENPSEFLGDCKEFEQKVKEQTIC